MGKPLVFGHRGAAAVAPENTIAAFLRARDLGADGVELDVTLTRDRVPVVIHDDTVDRTTNGHGLIRNMTILEVKQLDAGSWKSPKYRGEQIPTLAEVLDALADWVNPASPSRMPRGMINVEIKSMGLGTDGVEREVVNLIGRMNLESRILISSFNPLALERVKQLNPRLQRGLLYETDMPFYLRRAWLRFLAAPHALHPDHQMIDQAYMQWARRKHYAVNTWTVDDPAEAKRLAALGVEILISNQPDVICRALQPSS
ncbi:MAG: glycerophosphodiester phosphodiesterase family protein [Anaerolineae bacterium]